MYVWAPMLQFIILFALILSIDIFSYSFLFSIPSILSFVYVSLDILSSCQIQLRTANLNNICLLRACLSCKFGQILYKCKLIKISNIYLNLLIDSENKGISRRFYFYELSRKFRLIRNF